jgi:hypothetical protein
MTKKIPDHKYRKIKILFESGLLFEKVKKITGYPNWMINKVLNDVISKGTIGCCLGSKTEAYYSEQEMLNGIKFDYDKIIEEWEQEK